MAAHKIRRVALDTCTVEQKIAYNMAFRAEVRWGDKFRALPTAAAKSDATAKIRDFMLHELDCKPGKYDEDLIFIALNKGLRNYLERPFIAADYDTIGGTF